MTNLELARRALGELTPGQRLIVLSLEPDERSTLFRETIQLAAEADAAEEHHDE